MKQINTIQMIQMRQSSNNLLDKIITIIFNTELDIAYILSGYAGTNANYEQVSLKEATRILHTKIHEYYTIVSDKKLSLKTIANFLEVSVDNTTKKAIREIEKLRQYIKAIETTQVKLSKIEKLEATFF